MMPEPTAAQKLIIEDGLPPSIATLTTEERREIWLQKGVAPPKAAANTPPMKKPHPAEIAAEADMETAVRCAAHFLASLFRGVGTYDKAEASTVAGAMEAACQLESAAGGTRRAMIYAVDQDGRATLLTKAFIERMIALTKQAHRAATEEDEMKSASKSKQVKSLRERRAEAKGRVENAIGRPLTTAAKAGPEKKAAKAKARTPVGERARYDWKAAEEKAASGSIPAKPDFSAPTHARFLPIMKQIAEACAAKDVKALKAIEITPTSSTPKAMDRYRGLCIKALTAKA